MNVSVPEETEKQSVAAGFDNVEQYVYSLIRRDGERLAMEEGISAMNERRVQDFNEFDRRFCERHGIGE
ncbi:MAG: hypothetical protein AAGD07_22460 [Planctomycetota bacterium]